MATRTAALGQRPPCALKLTRAASKGSPAAAVRRVRASGTVVCTAVAADVSAAKSEALELLERAPALSFGALPDSTRFRLAELLSMLEAHNPTPSPTTSTVMDGDWRFTLVGTPAPGPVASPTRDVALLMYAGGFSPGAFAVALAEGVLKGIVQVQSVFVTVSALAPRAVVTAQLRAFDRSVSVRVKADLDTESPVRLAETWSEIEVDGNPIAIPGDLRYSRRVFVSYLDETMAVLRDASGAPSVLMRTAGGPPPAAAAAAEAPLPPMAMTNGVEVGGAAAEGESPAAKMVDAELLFDE